jgi:hypothetical protein
MMHSVPAGGMLTHGLFSYNLQFFWLLCRENNYEVLNLGLQHYGGATISPDVVYSNSTYAKSGANLPRADLAVPLLHINAILRKPTKKPYVTMLDVPNEAR